MAHLEGKVVLVTGAGRGVGRVVAQGFARRGAIVAANDITPVNLDGTIADIQAEGGRARDYIYDVAKSMPVRALVNQVVADWGRIDVLVNCARVEPHAPVLGMDEWDWQRTLDVNLSAPFYTMQAVGGVMRPQGGGVMVNIATELGYGGEDRQRAAYVASRSALIGLTRVAARELAVYQILVFAIVSSDAPPGLDGLADPALVALPPEGDGSSEQIAGLVIQMCL